MVYDILIVGQGLAGTLISWKLEQSGCTVYHVDPGHERASSNVAAGLMNPITGRRYVKSWRFDDLLPVARQTYRELEELLGITLYHEYGIIRSLFNHREENDWLARTGDPAYQPYMLGEPRMTTFADHIRPAYSYGEVRQSAQVHIGRLIRAYRERLSAKKALREEAFEYDQLDILDQGVQYGTIRARRVVFAEGAAAANNPFFAHLPFGGAKGQAIWVRIPGADFPKILKQRIFIVPWEEDVYWIGSTNSNHFDHDGPTGEARAYLTERLSDILTLPFELIDHRSAIKPTVKDRRPFLGRHHEYPHLYIFNGLGTKGTSLGPYWAAHLRDFILKNSTLDKEVDIRRFISMD